MANIGSSQRVCLEMGAPQNGRLPLDFPSPQPSDKVVLEKDPPHAPQDENYKKALGRISVREAKGVLRHVASVEAAENWLVTRERISKCRVPWPGFAYG